MSEVLTKLAQVLEQRKTADADDSYVASLFAKGLNKILEKVGEEANETILAAKDYQGTERTKDQGQVQVQPQGARSYSKLTVTVRTCRRLTKTWT